ncbi:MAG: sialate O-acetylesterase [Bacteroidales bacterium]|nr:sialate O-acetylesterase [Bacteroidales bacterium]
MKKNTVIILLSLLLVVGGKTYAQDPDFHIYLCLGQSNMEGAARAGSQDSTVNPRFQVMAAVDCENTQRKMGNWYPAVPPLCRCRTNLGPADYFGRTMVENLPDSIRVGVINVSIGGCKIELFDKDQYQSYVSTAPVWMVPMIDEYEGNPYGRLVEMAKLAQKDGIIKGILLHQGESNTNDTLWPQKVKVVYDNLMNDLSLNPDSVPLLAGEVVHADQEGICASMNVIIATLPQTIANAYVISSQGCTDGPDNLHFNAEGYRMLGRRYAIKMLSLPAYNITVP